MEQSKDTFRFDNFIEIQGTKTLDKATDLCNAAGFAYCVEPWGNGLSRIYARKDVAIILGFIEKGLKQV